MYSGIYWRGFGILCFWIGTDSELRNVYDLRQSWNVDSLSIRAWRDTAKFYHSELEANCKYIFTSMYPVVTDSLSSVGQRLFDGCQVYSLGMSSLWTGHDQVRIESWLLSPSLKIGWASCRVCVVAKFMDGQTDWLGCRQIGGLVGRAAKFVIGS